MATEHILTQSDSLLSLAEQHLDDPARWLEIAEYNKLDAPYLVANRLEAVDMLYSSGYLTIKRSSFANDLFIPKGSTFKTKPYLIGGLVKVFATTEDTIAKANEPVFYIHVRSTVSGDYGNVEPGLITEPGEELAHANINFASLSNEKPFTGGSNKRILTIGDTIYIPSEDGNNVAESADIETMLNLLGGEDLALEPMTGYERSFTADGFGDIKSVNGLANIEQAVIDRLMTEKGELPLHPEYGTDLATVIGTAQTPYSAKLAEIEIYESLAYEDRITDVDISRVEIVGTTVYVDLTYKPANTTREAIMNLVLNY